MGLEPRKDFPPEPSLHSLAEWDGESPGEAPPAPARRLGRQEPPLLLGSAGAEAVPKALSPVQEHRAVPPVPIVVVGSGSAPPAATSTPGDGERAPTKR